MIEKLRNLVSGEETEHPTLEECGGCLEAWICWRNREERDDGTVICGICGRVLIELDHGAFRHDPDNMPSRGDDE